MTTYLLAGAAVLAALFLLNAVLVEPRRFTLQRQELHSGALAAGQRLSILHISDLHFRNNDGRKLEFLKSLAEHEVDVVFVTGDLIDYDAGIAQCVEAVAAFRPRLGTYVVLGAHDYYHTLIRDIVRQVFKRVYSRHEEVDTARLVAGLKDSGATVLISERVELEHGGMKLDVVGIDDLKHGVVDLDAAFAGCRDDALRLVLIHEPSTLDEIADREPDFVFAGHTHGGQIRIPGLGALTTQAKLPLRHASGVFQVGKTTVHLNNGVGTGRVTPIRCFCRPEATIVDIVPEAGDQA